MALQRRVLRLQDQHQSHGWDNALFRLHVHCFALPGNALRLGGVDCGISFRTKVIRLGQGGFGQARSRLLGLGGLVFAQY